MARISVIWTLKKEDWFHADGFPIAVERRNPQEPFGLHTHEFSELVLITGGRGLHITGEDSWQLSAGDVYVIGGSRPHDYLNTRNLQLINVLFEPQELSLDLKDLALLPGYHALFHLEPAWRKRHGFKSRLRLSQKEIATAVGLIDQLDEELRARNAGFGFLATAAFMQLLGFLSRCYERSRSGDSRSLLRLAQTISHIESRYTEEINLSALVEMSQMSKRSFIREFVAAMGCAPITYVIQLRLSRAAKLLRQSDRSIVDIAYEVGFNDSNYFTRQFRKQFGVAPRTYRQRRVL